MYSLGWKTYKKRQMGRVVINVLFKPLWKALTAVLILQVTAQLDISRLEVKIWTQEYLRKRPGGSL